jgi:L-rhamnonate dehydratase
MYFSTQYYGRRGIVVNAISAVDLALWDLLAKWRKEPVHALLGGPVRDELLFYATGARPDLAQQLGFIGGKMPLQHGPAESEEGLKKNLTKLEDMRNKVGEDFWLMFDCWMSLDLNYATRLAHGAHRFGLRWVEECLSPDDYWTPSCARTCHAACWSRQASTRRRARAFACCWKWAAATSSSPT